MNYALLFLGICLVVLAVVLFILDAIKSRSEIRDLEKANAQAELLIEELNELSSIIVDEMDKRYNNMLDIYKELLAASEPETKEQDDADEKTADSENTAFRDRKNEILDLHRLGKLPGEIASKMGIGTGEVELVIKFAGQGVGNVEKTV